MELPAKYNVWLDKPGRINYIKRRLGRKIEILATYIAIFGVRLKRNGQEEEWREIDVQEIVERWKKEHEDLYYSDDSGPV